jgi:hypothetical protein
MLQQLAVGAPRPLSGEFGLGAARSREDVSRWSALSRRHCQRPIAVARLPAPANARGSKGGASRRSSWRAIEPRSAGGSSVPLIASDGIARDGWNAFPTISPPETRCALCALVDGVYLCSHHESAPLCRMTAQERRERPKQPVLDSDNGRVALIDDDAIVAAYLWWSATSSHCAFDSWRKP